MGRREAPARVGCLRRRACTLLFSSPEMTKSVVGGFLFGAIFQSESTTITAYEQRAISVRASSPVCSRDHRENSDGSHFCQCRRMVGGDCMGHAIAEQDGH